MNEGSYQDKRVRELLHKNYVAVHVDAEAEPDIVSEGDVFAGNYVLAVHALRDEFIDVTVVCADKLSKACTRLWRTALHEAPHVRKIVKLQGPGRYPDIGEPAAFICTSRLCSDPITANADAAKRIAKFMGRLDQMAQ